MDSCYLMGYDSWPFIYFDAQRTRICFVRALQPGPLVLWTYPHDSSSASLFYGISCFRPVLYFLLLLCVGLTPEE